jgi:hypothetical protein
MMTLSLPRRTYNLKQKPDWFERLEYYAFRIALLILFFNGLVRLIRGELHW